MMTVLLVSVAFLGFALVGLGFVGVLWSFLDWLAVDWPNGVVRNARVTTPIAVVALAAGIALSAWGISVAVEHDREVCESAGNVWFSGDCHPGLAGGSDG